MVETRAPQSQRRASIHDVASHAGVSAATVHKVMHGDSTVRVENAEKVRASIEALNYRVDPLASSLRRSQRKIVGVIVPEFESVFFGGIVAELEILAERRGYTLVATSSRESEERERELIARMYDWRVSGLVLAPVQNEHGPAAAFMKRYDMRGVLIDRVVGDDAFDTVSADSAAASAQIADGLLGFGHRHVLVVCLDAQAASLQASRLDGFKARMEEIDPEAIVDVVRCENDTGMLHAAVQAYFASGKRPTAIYSLFLRATLVVLSEVRQRGWRIPGDISLAGFDDADWMQVMHPPMAAVVQPVREIASNAMELLFRRVEGEAGPPVARWETCEVLMRGSVGSPSSGPHH